MEAKAGLGFLLEHRPVGARGFEQSVGAVDVGRDEVAGAVDRAVDMRFGGQMDYAAGVIIDEQAVQRSAVADIGAAEDMVRMVRQIGQGFQIAGIGQLVDIDVRQSLPAISRRIRADR